MSTLEGKFYHRFMGLDPGSSCMGFAIYDEESNRIVRKGSYKAPGKSVDARLLHIQEWIETELLGPPEAGSRICHSVGYEKMFSVGNAADAPLAIIAWFIRVACARRSIPFIEIPHAAIYKHAVGDGTLDKKQVQRILGDRFGVSFANTDESDAVATAIAASIVPKIFLGDKKEKKKLRQRKVEASLYEIDDCLLS